MQLPFGRATDFEFRYRFWLIAATFAAVFALYNVDHQGAPSLFVHSRFGYHIAFAIASLVIIIAGLLRTWASAYLRASVVHDLDLHAEKLVADGPFRYVRNPLYLGSWVMTIAIGFLASRLGWVAGIAAMFVFTHRLIAREEAELLKTQGESFAAYCRAVPRFWPSLWPRIPAGTTPPRWKQAIAGEFYFWCFAFGMIGLAITLDARVPQFFFIGVFVIYSLHYVLLWMEKKDWIYYRRQRPASSTRAALGAMEAFIHPEIQYVKEDQGQREFEIQDKDPSKD
jgi:protein-S-isoprenylcysteine O-methyltransferase Ste14